MNIRKTWWVTRPERTPDDLRYALKALNDVTNNFGNVRWDHTLQRKYESQLVSYNIKRKGVSKDGSGGRTWVAMLKMFNYVYITKNRQLKLTDVGSEVLNGKNVYKNIKKQIMTFQMPNPYFLSSDYHHAAHLDSDFEIQPIRFLLKLANEKRLNYEISENEISFFVLTSHKNTDFNNVVNDILKFRGMTDAQKLSKEKSISKKFDNRKRKDSTQRTFKENMNDIANPCMILAEYTGLTNRTKSKRNPKLYSNAKLAKQNISEINKWDNRYPFDTMCFTDTKAAIFREGLSVNKYKANYRPGIKTASSKSKDTMMIHNLEKKHPELKTKNRSQIIQILTNSVGFSPKKAQKFANLIKQYAQIHSFSKDFQHQYKHEKDNTKHNKNRQFEIDTEHVLQHMGLKVEDHPESPSPDNNSNENEDSIVFLSNSKYLILVDAKNYHNKSNGSKFELTANLRDTMVTSYIKGYKNYKKRNPRYFLYVVAKDASGESNMNIITKDSDKCLGLHCTGAIISADALMHLADHEDRHSTSVNTNEKYLIKLCKTNKKFITYGDIEECLGLND